MPPLTLENAGALVPGGATARDIQEEHKTMKAAQQLPAEIEVEVVRPFTDHNRKVTEKGKRYTLPRVFALEMRAANKVKFVEPAPAAAPSAPVSAQKGKG